MVTSASKRNRSDSMVCVATATAPGGWGMSHDIHKQANMLSLSSVQHFSKFYRLFFQVYNGFAPPEC
jgi:hypothetical protein